MDVMAYSNAVVVKLPVPAAAEVPFTNADARQQPARSSMQNAE
jgi:hypothetical protein